MKLKKKLKRLIIQNFVFNDPGKHYYNFTIFSSFGNLPENVYDDKISLKGSKIQQKSMEDIIRDLEL